MILDLPDTTTSEIARALVSLREDGGAVALGRVLTLVIIATGADEEQAIESANAASREHPMRVIVIVDSDDSGADAGLDAQIRVGGDAGASEVIVVRPRGGQAQHPESFVMGLLLPDAPVVAWWVGAAPQCVSETEIGRIAQRRITDSAAHEDTDEALRVLATNHCPGDTDLAWTRITLWRTQLAAALDQPPHLPVLSAEVVGAVSSPSSTLLAGWLAERLQVPVELRIEPGIGEGYGVHRVRLNRENGPIEFERTDGSGVRLSQVGQPDHQLSLPRRGDQECLAEELRHLDPDEVFAAVITDGIGRIAPSLAKAES